MLRLPLFYAERSGDFTRCTTTECLFKMGRFAHTLWVRLMRKHVGVYQGKVMHVIVEISKRVRWALECLKGAGDAEALVTWIENHRGERQLTWCVHNVRDNAMVLTIWPVIRAESASKKTTIMAIHTRIVIFVH